MSTARRRRRRRSVLRRYRLWVGIGLLVVALVAAIAYFALPEHHELGDEAFLMWWLGIACSAVLGVAMVLR